MRAVPAGEPVGYGCHGASDQSETVLVADGLRRELGDGKGSLFIKNRRVPIAGSIAGQAG
ncbi:MAG: hypothetical protein U5L72_13960 [Bacteroidales bacterium]|nr:hypothetical protein [Bacteroidales bacterium]